MLGLVTFCNRAFALLSAVAILAYGCRSSDSSEIKSDEIVEHLGPLREASTSAKITDSAALASVLWDKISARRAELGSQVSFADEPEKYFIIRESQGEDKGDIICNRYAQETSCGIRTRAWPRLTRSMARIVSDSLGVTDAMPVTIGVSGNTGTLTCSLELGVPVCKLASLPGNYVNDWERPEPDPTHKLPAPIQVEIGAIDEVDGKPLPKATTLYQTQFSAGNVNLATYKATNEELAAIWNENFDSFPEARDKFEMEWANEFQGAPELHGCRKEEAYALRSYASAGFKSTNSALRKLVGGKVDGQALDPRVERLIRAIASGIRCHKQKKEKITYRGANLTDEVLSRYQVGRTIVERSFTSTAQGSVPDNFVGNVEFRIWDAKGALLKNLNPTADDNEDEGELLINAGTLFKVVYRDKEGEMTIIELQQLP